jgi:O-succinylbenzoate synthase
VDDSIDTLLDHVSGYIDEGYRRIKLKIQPGFDIEPTRAVRSAWPEIPLQVDANQAYSRDHIAHLAGLDEFNLLLIEQPMHEDDLVAHKWLADRIETPVCLDESVISVNNAESLIDFGACEIVNIKAGRVGGYLEAKKTWPSPAGFPCGAVGWRRPVSGGLRTWPSHHSTAAPSPVIRAGRTGSMHRM